MSPPVGNPVVAIINSKSLRRASITSFLEPWANSEDLRLMSFSLDQAREVLHLETNLRIVIVNVGGKSIAEPGNLQQLKMLRALATGVPFVVISDRENAQEIAAAFSAETKGFIHSGIDAGLACEALSFILRGGSYFPPHPPCVNLKRNQGKPNKSEPISHGAAPPMAPEQDPIT